MSRLHHARRRVREMLIEAGAVEVDADGRRTGEVGGAT